MGNMHFDTHISQQFNEELEKIKTRMLEMGGTVQKQLEDAVSALENADSELAEHVLKVEEQVDAAEISIDEACILLIARRQPAASDLRMVMAVNKTVRDLERIGDEAKRIAKMAIMLSEEGSAPRGYVEIRHIANGVRHMLDRSLDAFARYDVESAVATLKADEQVDLDYKTSLRELVTYMMEDPRSIGRVMSIMWALRALERVGDHSKNICEQVVYLVNGKDIRHGQLDKMDV
ncbi:phosphate signaling complex protein PhoU [Porticoccaceae bacterium LTM1]|nr:phosphate signaling complex protein PhoU [Porticoccaceae bacterium LTM1]